MKIRIKDVMTFGRSWTWWEYIRMDNTAEYSDVVNPFDLDETATCLARSRHSAR